MSVSNNSQDKVTTMTAIVKLDFELNLDNLVYFIPVNKGLKKIQNGDIVMIRYKEDKYIKSIINITNKSFRNSITLSIVFNKRLVSVKLFRTKIQICGADSDNTIVFCVEKILEHIRSIIQLKYSRTNIYVISFLNNYPEGNLKEKISKLKMHENILVSPVYDKRFKNEHDRLKSVFNYSINKVMINYKYDLGFSISKLRLKKLLENNNNFFVSYQNITDFSVYIMCFDDNKKFVCYLIIYKSGLITQSGSEANQKMMKDMYEKFLNLINKNKRQIYLPSKKKIEYLAFYQT